MLTEAQERVLAAVREITADSWPATVREIGRVAGLASPSTVHVHLLALERAGLIEHSPRHPRHGVRAANASVSENGR